LISIVKTTDDLAQARALFSEYATSIDNDLSFQDFGKELANLPGENTPPGGGIFLARMGSEAVGCVALTIYATVFSVVDVCAGVSVFASAGGVCGLVAG